MKSTIEPSYELLKEAAQEHLIKMFPKTEEALLVTKWFSHITDPHYFVLFNDREKLLHAANILEIAQMEASK